jgi:hypothetical protein
LGAENRERIKGEVVERRFELGMRMRYCGEVMVKELG